MKNLLRKIVPDFGVGIYHFGWALLGALRYGFPSRSAGLKVIGVTGTNGKSTTVFLISRILEKAGFKTAVLSSIEFKIGSQAGLNKTSLTMPGHLAIQKFLRRAVEASCQYAVIEVTSEGIKQHRHRFIGFDTAVFTNLAPEHLESHGGFENYKKAKGKLFAALRPNGKIVINLDDKQADYFLNFKAGEKWGYSLQKSESQKPSVVIKAEDCLTNEKGVSFRAKQTEFSLNLPGEFNIYNALASISACLAERVPMGIIQSALTEVKNIPGRMELIAESPFTVIVDLAHTPDALEQVFKMLKSGCRGKMIGVFGSAGGGRDKWKRPALGQVAGKYLDKIIITSEDPRDEDARIIASQIAGGIIGQQAEQIIDRREAIKRAVSLAQEGDLVIITGKGCEPWMKIGKKKYPWDDREAARQALAELC